MENSKEEKILEYVREQYNTSIDLFGSIDSRIGTYLIITGLIWGILIQSTGYLGTLLSGHNSINNLLECTILIALFVSSNLFLLLALFCILLLLAKMKFAVPGVISRETILELVSSELVKTKDITISAINNYLEAYKINLNLSVRRTQHFVVIRIFMSLGVVFFVIYISLIGRYYLNKNMVQNKTLVKQGGNMSYFTKDKGDEDLKDKTKEDNSKPTMDSSPDYITLGVSSKDKKDKARNKEK